MTRKAELPTSEAGQQSLFDFVPDAVLVSDKDGRIVRVNSRAKAMFGYSREELLGQLVDLLVPERLRGSHIGHRAHYYSQPHTRPMGISRDLSACHKDGSEIPVDISLSAFTQDEKLFVISVVRDTSECRRLESKLRESQRMLSTLMSNLPGMAYRCKYDRDWTLEFASDGCLDLTGYAAADFVQNKKASFGELIHPEDRDKVWDDVQSAVREKQPFQLTFRITTATGNEKWVLEQGIGIFSSDGTLEALEGFVCDITARKRAEDTLRAQNRELQILHETSQTILTSRNIQTMAASILEKALAVSHCDLGVIRLLDRTSVTLDPVASHGYLNPKNLHPDDATTGRLLRIFARKETVVSERVRDKPGLRIFKREGVQSLILIPVLADHDLLGALQLGSRRPRKFDPYMIKLLETLGSNFGIAVQKNRLLEETLASQAQLRALSRRLVKTQESERHYLARELHDEIGSLLTGLKLTLGGSAGPGTDQIDARTAAAHTIIDDALAKTRSLSHSLRPPMLDDLGLLPALSWHIKEFTARTDVQVNFEHHNLQLRFPEEVEIAAYRIVQEALTNIARHAQVHEATVTLWADPSGLGIEISDQGAGFDQTAATLANASSVGLAGIRERVASLGGSLKITSAPGTGTSVTVELPLATTGEKTVRSEQ